MVEILYELAMSRRSSDNNLETTKLRFKNFLLRETAAAKIFVQVRISTKKLMPKTFDVKV